MPTNTLRRFWNGNGNEGIKRGRVHLLIGPVPFICPLSAQLFLAHMPLCPGS
jgi:hypothetical protein